jgi:hypothetical protein
VNRPEILRRRIKLLTWLFIVGLVLSGATAIPLEWELDVLARGLGIANLTSAQATTGLHRCILTVREALHETGAKYPFVAYGTDWLAFGHFVIAIAFVGALRDPIRNRWLFSFGMIACALVVPYAVIFGGIRGIPLYWRLIDCSFGLFGAVPLWLSRRWVNELESCAGKVPELRNLSRVS